MELKNGIKYIIGYSSMQILNKVYKKYINSYTQIYINIRLILKELQSAINISLIFHCFSF